MLALIGGTRKATALYFRLTVTQERKRNDAGLCLPGWIWQNYNKCLAEDEDDRRLIDSDRRGGRLLPSLPETARKRKSISGRAATGFQFYCCCCCCESSRLFVHQYNAC